MSTFNLIRVSYRDDGTFGVLLENDAPFALTLERPWLNNSVGKSCIPKGLYRCQRVQSPKFGNTFQVMDVVGRSNILFHKGNINDDTQGCILIGEEFSTWSDGRTSVARSGSGYMEFMDRLAQRDEFWINIQGVY